MLVTEAVERYDALCEATARSGADLYVQKYSQTVNNPQKNKEVMVASAPTRDVACVATSWDIHDTIEQDDGGGLDGADLEMLTGGTGADGSKQNQTALETNVENVVAAALSSAGCLLDAEAAVTITAPAGSRKGKSHSKVGSTSRSRAAGGGTSRIDGASTRASSMASSSRVGISRSRQTANSSHEDSSRGQSRKGSVVADAADARPRAPESADERDVLLQREANRILSSKSLIMSLDMVERAIQQNMYHVAHRLYRANPGGVYLERLLAAEEAQRQAEAEAAAAAATVQDEDDELSDYSSEAGDEDDGSRTKSGNTTARQAVETGGGVETGPVEPEMEKLWTYRCDLTRGRNVSCMAWNQANQDLLAVGYGQFEFSVPNPADTTGPDASSAEGLVLFWSLKSPEYPLCVIQTPAGVTALAFSEQHANLLAVGYYDGTCVRHDGGVGLWDRGGQGRFMTSRMKYGVVCCGLLLICIRILVYDVRVDLVARRHGGYFRCAP